MWHTGSMPVNTSEAVCEHNDSFCKYSLISLLCSYEQKNCFSAILFFRGCSWGPFLLFLLLYFYLLTLPKRQRTGWNTSLFTFQRNTSVCFLVDDVHKLLLKGFQWTSVCAGGFLVTNDWKWCVLPNLILPWDVQKNKKKSCCFHNMLVAQTWAGAQLICVAPRKTSRKHYLWSWS